MRKMCYRCFWPEPLCWCGSITPMGTRTKFVILMHPHEFKRIKANTGRLTHLCLADSEIHIGESFEKHEAVQALIDDPKNYPVLLYPGHGARDLSKGELHAEDFAERRLVVFLLDATWRLVRPMLRLSPNLQRLPKIMFSNAAPSRYVIKRQPEPGCLSTLEATHELLAVFRLLRWRSIGHPDGEGSSTASSAYCCRSRRRLLAVFGRNAADASLRIRPHLLACPEPPAIRRRSASRRRPSATGLKMACSPWSVVWLAACAQ
jgi:DTW domain-containing protein YfiP